MAEEKEAAYPIEKFLGIDRNTVREKAGPLSFWSCKNLWEKTLNLLETRGGSDQHNVDFPSKIEETLAVHKIYKSDGSNSRICAIKCTPEEEAPGAPSGIALSFSSASGGGYWNGPQTFSSLVYKSGSYVSVRLVGYGVDRWYSVLASSVTGYSASANQKLVVTLSASQGENVTGLEIYSLVSYGSFGGSAYSRTMWVGYQNIAGVSSGVYNFVNTPLGQSGSTPDATEIGELKRSPTVQVKDDDPFTTTPALGALERGKTYYVAIASHHLRCDDDGSQRSSWRIPGVTRTGDSAIVPITIPDRAPQYGWYLQVDGDLNTVSGLLLIGESPELMQPVSCFNNAIGGYITSVPQGSPALFNMIPSADNTVDYVFLYSDYSIKDMFVRIDDEGELTPVFCSRLDNAANTEIETGALSARVAGLQTELAVLPMMGDSSEYSFRQFGDLAYFVNGYDCDAKIVLDGSGLYARLQSRTGSCYFQTDGNIAGSVIEEFQGKSMSVTFTDTGDLVTYLAADLLVNGNAKFEIYNGLKVRFTTINTTTGITANTTYYVRDYNGSNHTFKLSATYFGSALTLTTNGTGTLVLPYAIQTLPLFESIEVFEGSVVLAGGIESIDRITERKKSGSRNIYFSQALVPYDFTIPAASLYQTVAVQDDPAPITALGIYSNTSGDSGPFTQLLTAKKNKAYVLNHLPTATNGVLDPDVRQIILSSKVGVASKNLICPSPVGTIIVSSDNVYVLRDTGEPTPVGQEISPILKRAVLTNAQAVYHDRHIKISFYHEDYDDDELGSEINNVELWLNLNKMVQERGGSSWVGPMVGHNNQYSFVEDHDGDGIDDDYARDRFCCDGVEPRLYRTDIEPEGDAFEVQDFDALVESELDSKEFEISTQDNNWNKLLKRTYWKLRLVNDSVTPAELEEDTYMDGQLFETKSFEAYGADDICFDEQTLKLNRIFPTGRPRGRTVRKLLRTKSRIGISGYQFNYEIERRRI